MEQVQILQKERIRTETPEAGLWRAVIELAIVDLSDPDLREATLKWFTSASDQPMTFRWICVHLDLDASAVWAALKQRGSWKDPAKPVASAPYRVVDINRTSIIEQLSLTCRLVFTHLLDNFLQTLEFGDFLHPKTAGDLPTMTPPTKAFCIRPIVPMLLDSVWPFGLFLMTPSIALMN